MKIAIAQLNPIVGDLSGNAALVEDAAARAAAEGAELLVTSELVICGYPPKDLLHREGFVAACRGAVEQLAREIDPALGVLVGHPDREGVPEGRIANAVSLLHGGQIIATVQKTLLPNYDVFDERRYFFPSKGVQPLEFRGLKLGVHICEDAWWHATEPAYRHEEAHETDPIAELAAAGAELFINVSASPFEIDKPGRRMELIERHTIEHGRPFLFVNQVGGNDDLVFDGHSFVMQADGQIVLELPGFDSGYALLDTDELPPPITVTDVSREWLLFEALVLGLKDYAGKCGFTDCVLGLSGGIDSALACYIAAAALGPERVHGLLMPSRFSSDHSVDDARKMSELLGIDFEVIGIDAVHRAYEQSEIVGADLKRQPGGLADQNLQARIRGAMVMIRSNSYGWLPLATGNKSELAVGYCTLYGDMAGGFAVLSDVLKRDVYGVARFINDEIEQREMIPESILNKAPSAELAPDQFDQDVLPPYPVLDAILEGLIERERSVASLSKEFPIETVRWVAGRLDRNEFKRRQMPPGIKLSGRAFGSGRRMPMAARFNWS